MHAHVAYRHLVHAVRALQPYTTTATATTPHTRLLHLSAHDGLLTLGATSYPETAEVDLAGAASDGHYAVAPAALLAALTAIRPTNRRRWNGGATLRLDGASLHLSATTQGGSVSLPCDTSTAAYVDLTPYTTLVISDLSVSATCRAVSQVGWAADTTGKTPAIGVVRFARDAGACLVIEATDRYRAHRAIRDEPDATAVNARMPIAAVGRAVDLLTACDPAGSLTVEADDHRVGWRTGKVRLSCWTSPDPYPDLEPLRERVTAIADSAFSVERAAVRAALTAATALAEAYGGRPIVIAPDRAGGTATVMVSTSDGQVLYRMSVPAAGFTGAPRALRVRPQHARDAFAFLDGETASIHLPPGAEPAYLESGSKHAILAQVPPS